MSDSSSPPLSPIPGVFSPPEAVTGRENHIEGEPGTPNAPNGLGPETGSGAFSYSVTQMIKFGGMARAPNKIVSDSFKCGGYDWHLEVYPRGLPKRPGYFAAFVVCEDATKNNVQVHVECTFVLVAKDPSKNIQMRFTTVIHANCVDQGWDSIVLSSQLADSFVINDTLNIMLKLDLPDPSRKWLGKYRADYDSKKETGLIGLINQGATCYMNVLLQSWYHIGALRKAVYQMPIVAAKKESSIAWQLQRLYFELQSSNRAAETKNLTKSFGWKDMDGFRQQDIQEFAVKLQDVLEERMKNTPVDGTFQRLFVGELQTFIECINVNYVSKRSEKFYDLNMTVKGIPTLLKSFEDYVATERLDGSNQYRVDQHGLQDAVKGSRFLKFPDILQLTLKRFEYDPYEDKMVKINDLFEFPAELDLSPFLANVPEADASKIPQYRLYSVLVHVGGFHGGHYYGFIRPSATDPQWYKFDDELVVKVEDKEAVDDNFGGSLAQSNPYASNLKIQKQNSAYMLTYVRNSAADQILAPVTEADVPASVVDGFKEDERLRAIEEEARIKAAKSTVISVMLERDIISAGTNTVEIEVASKPARKFAIEKSKNLNDLRELIELEIGIPQSKQVFFRFNNRQNGTSRAAAPITNAESQLPFGPIDSTVISPLVPANTPCWDLKPTFYLVEMDRAAFESDLPGLLSQQGARSNTSTLKCLLFFKFFDVAKQQLQFIGSRIVSRSQPFKSIVPLLVELANSYYNRSVITANTPLRIFEELKAPLKIPEYSLNDNIDEKGFVTGDIVIFFPQYEDHDVEILKEEWLGRVQEEKLKNKIVYDAKMFVYFFSLHLF